MELYNKWLGLLNFYLILCSGGELTREDFTEARLLKAYLDNSGLGFQEMNDTAAQLGLEFQKKIGDTESKILDIQETQDGSLLVSLPDMQPIL